MDCKNDFSNGDNFYVNSLSKQLIAPVRKKKYMLRTLVGDCMTAAIKIIAYKPYGELSLSFQFNSVLFFLGTSEPTKVEYIYAVTNSNVMARFFLLL